MPWMNMDVCVCVVCVCVCVRVCGYVCADRLGVYENDAGPGKYCKDRTTRLPGQGD